MTYTLTTTLDRPFDDTVVRVREALAEQGFGVITEIDMQATLRAKLGVEIAPQLILGACNPSYAVQALGVEDSIGVLLPCNVVVRADGESTVVEAIDPDTMVALTGNADVAPLAADIKGRLQAAFAALED